MKLYKLTDQLWRTRPGEDNETEWGEGVTHTPAVEASEAGEMCGPGWIHAYTDPYLAVVFNPIHANFHNPVLWEAEGEVGASDGLKVGVRKLTTVRRMPLPKIETNALVRFAIYVALEVYRDEDFVRWAKLWLSGVDRTRKGVVEAERAAARADAWVVGARAADWAAKAAAWAAEGTAEWAAKAEKGTAEWVAWAALEAAGVEKTLDFAPILQKAIADEAEFVTKQQ